MWQQNSNKTLKRNSMKTTHLLTSLLIPLFCLGALTGCDPSDGNDDDMIWDIAPIVLYISVQDAAGNDLLNPETPGNIANQGIKAIYKDKTYEKDILVAQTKAYLAILYGLQTIKDKSGRYYLAFGEFDGAKTFEDESVTIDWNDGSTDVITFSSKLTWVAKKPVTNRKFCLNGVENPETNRSSFLITKQPALQAGSSFL